MILKVALALALAPIVNLGPGSDGRTVAVHRGARIVVALPANASTGYAWTIASKPTRVLRRVSQRYVRSTSKLIGAGGQYRATFVARAQGTTVLRLRYVRRTQPATPAAERYSVTIVVR